MDHLGLVAVLCQDSMIRIEGLAPPARAGSSTWADPPINQWFLNAHSGRSDARAWEPHRQDPKFEPINALTQWWKEDNCFDRLDR